MADAVTVRPPRPERITISTNDIYVNDEFNCRESISTAALDSLKLSIKDQGQLQPVVAQRSSECNWAETDKPYVLLAGFRRFYACRQLGYEIDVNVTTGLDHLRARALNFSENLQREDLTPSEEAKILSYFSMYGFTMKEIAQYFQRSVSWVSNRLALSELPEEVRQARDAGEINDKQTRTLLKVRENPEQVESRLKEMREAYQRAGSNTGSGAAKKAADKTAGILGKSDLDCKIQRVPTECEAINILLLTLGQGGLATRCLAWAAGNITTRELFDDLKKLDKHWLPPEKFEPKDYL